MQHRVIHLCLGGPLITEHATLIDIIRGLGVHHHRFPKLHSILIMACDGHVELSQLHDVCKLISSYLLQLFPHVTSVTPITSGSLSTVPANIYYNLIVMLAASIHEVTVNGIILGNIPHVHFQNLTNIRIIDPSEGTASRTMRVNPNTLKTIEIVNSSSNFPWGMFGDASNPIVFPNVEQLIMRTFQNRHVYPATQIGRFKLQFPRLWSLCLMEALDSYTDALDLIKISSIGSLVIFDDANKLQHLNPKLVRNIREFCIGDSQRTQIPVLDKNSFFIKIFDIPAKLNKVTLSLPQADFPPIKDAKWPMLRSLRLIARSISLQSIEMFMTQLPWMHTLDLSMSHSDQQANDEVVCSRRTPLSTSVLVFGLKIAFPMMRAKTWLLMATRRLPELYKLVLSKSFEVDKAALRRVYKNGLAFV
ncbi:hypothetical protein DL89DRAFT_267075 [Linderina pennispora]|uniref:Uncharacterized protein n=1 Tax=Linderina pennispora TaxID=61395 RepID=A0A1Y1WCM9_9FUNG|nr:uncharacterized protein DL89DRAFT_267075 [Linderina pennispora]ORX70976.1 hypothetical protein DL89DRAFT_267075 [Linderina pennispora]